MTLPYPPPWQDLPTLAQHTCLGESTIEHWVRRGVFPKPHKINGVNRWRWKEVDKWLAGDSGSGAASPERLAEEITNATRETQQH